MKENLRYGRLRLPARCRLRFATVAFGSLRSPGRPPFNTGSNTCPPLASILGSVNIQRTAAPSREPGLLIVQVDGLSHRHLQEAFDRDLMPNLEDRIESGRLQEGPWHSGLPSQTVVVQGGLLYGSRALPANQWFDKSQGRVVDCVSLDDADAVDAELTRTGQPIVAGGTSYLTPMSGGAENPRFNISELAEKKAEGGTRKVVREILGDTWAVGKSLFRHPIATAQTAAHFVKRAYRETQLRKEEGLPFAFGKEKALKPVEIGFKEAFLTDATVADMGRKIRQGAPVLYVDLPNFDEMSHTYGPRVAFEALPTVDRNLGTLFQALDASPRSYNVVLVSDHGQVGSAHFHELYGQSLQDLAASLLPPSATTTTVEARVPHPIESWIPHGDPCAEAEGGRVLSLDFGSGAHVYLTEEPGALSRSELAAGYPRLVPGLVAHPGVAFVVVRDGDATEVQGKGGSLRIEADGREVVTGQNPLAPFGPAPQTPAEIHAMAHRQHTGDVIVFGEQVGDKLVDFSLRDFRGLHGGIGGHQDEPFIAFSPGMPVHPDRYAHAADLHADLYPLRPSDC